MRPGPLLHADLTDPPIFAGSLHDLGAFFDRSRERFLHVYVFASVQRVDSDSRMPMVGRCDQHCIHVLQIENLTMIGERLRLGRLRFCAVDMGVVDVAYRGNSNLGVELEFSEIMDSTVSRSNEGQVEFLVSS